MFWITYINSEVLYSAALFPAPNYPHDIIFILGYYCYMYSGFTLIICLAARYSSLVPSVV